MSRDFSSVTRYPTALPSVEVPIGTRRSSQRASARRDDDAVGYVPR